MEVKIITHTPRRLQLLISYGQSLARLEGTIGGEFGGTETGNYYATAQYETKFAPIIMNGILYYTQYPVSSTNPTGWSAIELKTGQRSMD